MSKDSATLSLARNADKIERICNQLSMAGNKGNMYSPLEGQSIKLLDMVYWHGYKLSDIYKVMNG